jgi:hypothetical protein
MSFRKDFSDRETLMHSAFVFMTLFMLASAPAGAAGVQTDDELTRLRQHLNVGEAISVSSAND